MNSLGQTDRSGFEVVARASANEAAAAERRRLKPATLKIRMADGSTFRVEGTIKDTTRATKPWKVVDLGPGLMPMRTYWLNPDQIVYVEEIPGA